MGKGELMAAEKRNEVERRMTIRLRAGVSPRLQELVPELPASPIPLRVAEGSVWISSPGCGERVVNAGEVFHWDGDQEEIVESLTDQAHLELSL